MSPWRREDVGEAATAKQEVEARARARRHASASRQRLKTAVPLVGWAAKWTCQVGCTGELQVSQVTFSFLYFISCFIFFCNFVAFLKMLRHFQKSPNCSCPLFSM